MITVLTGDDSFEIAEKRAELEASFAGISERVDGSVLELRDIPDLFMGQSLFSDARLVFVTDLSQSASVWQKLPEWLSRVSDDVHVVLVEGKLDKRTVSYKELKKSAEFFEYAAWGERDSRAAEAWVRSRASAQGLTLPSAAASHLVRKVGVDKWALAQSLDIIALTGDAPTPKIIDEVIASSPSESVFALFETALRGDAEEAQRVLRALEVQGDAYALFALISSQAVQLQAVTLAGAEHNPEKTFGIHPFVASKLKRVGSMLGARKVSAVVGLVAQTDADMKRSKAEPWLLLESLLVKIATL